MSLIEDIPFAGRKHINVLEEGYAGSEMIPLPPAKIATARSVSSAGVLGGSPMTVTFNASTTFFTVCAGAYPVIFRYRAAGDTNHVTLVSGAYPKDEIVSANSVMQFAKPEGIVSLSLDVLTTQPNITVIEK